MTDRKIKRIDDSTIEIEDITTHTKTKDELLLEHELLINQIRSLNTKLEELNTQLALFKKEK